MPILPRDSSRIKILLLAPCSVKATIRICLIKTHMPGDSTLTFPTILLTILLELQVLSKIFIPLLAILKDLITKALPGTCDITRGGLQNTEYVECP